ncbi:MAG: type IV secretion system DNA-binding domain-containing protein, partial [Rhodocyclaceae bacterium]|nr:type IV secretion system DNA-binding domain-containing protein [Rhodocyclaceae bacterium]
MLKLFKQLGGASPAASTVSLGGVPLTRKQEVVHTLLAGSTGTGKTTALEEMLTGIMARQDRCVVLDPNGHYLSHFHRKGDVILNPFDKRSPGWNPFNEVRRPYDFDKVARSIVPNGHGSDAAWHFYSQILIAEVMRALIAKGENTTEALIHTLTVLPADELKVMVTGTAAAGLFDKDSAKALASTRFVVSSFLKPYQYLSAGDFSLRNWLESGEGNLYLTWREDMTTSLAPLMAAWVDVLCTATLSLPADPGRRLWLLMDELASLGKISSLEDALTKGRKHGLCCVAGIQSTAQLDRLYGRESAIVLRSCFRNLCAFAIAKIDVETADIISRALGEREVDRTTKTKGRSSSGSSESISMQRVRERVVLG